MCDVVSLPLLRCIVCAIKIADALVRNTNLVSAYISFDVLCFSDINFYVKGSRIYTYYGVYIKFL